MNFLKTATHCALSIMLFASLNAATTSFSGDGAFKPILGRATTPRSTPPPINTGREQAQSPSVLRVVTVLAHLGIGETERKEPTELAVKWSLFAQNAELESLLISISAPIQVVATYGGETALEFEKNISMHENFYRQRKDMGRLCFFALKKLYDIHKTLNQLKSLSSADLVGFFVAMKTISDAIALLNDIEKLRFVWFVAIDGGIFVPEAESPGRMIDWNKWPQTANFQLCEELRKGSNLKLFQQHLLRLMFDLSDKIKLIDCEDTYDLSAARKILVSFVAKYLRVS